MSLTKEIATKLVQKTKPVTILLHHSQPRIWVSPLSLLHCLDSLWLRRLMNRIGIRTANSKVPVCQLVCIPSRFSQVLILPFSVAQEQDRKKRELGPARKISVCASPPWFHPPLHKVMDSGRLVDTMDTWMAVTLLHRFNIHSCWSFFSWYREIIFFNNQGFPD